MVLTEHHSFLLKRVSFQELIKHGYKPYSIPVLEFNFINIDKLSRSFLDSDNHSAVVFTSQRAVEASVLAFPKEDGKIVKCSI